MPWAPVCARAVIVSNGLFRIRIVEGYGPAPRADLPRRRPSAIVLAGRPRARALPAVGFQPGRGTRTRDRRPTAAPRARRPATHPRGPDPARARRRHRRAL